MSDKDIAIKQITQMDSAIVIVKDGSIIFESKEKGIKPLFLACKRLGDQMKGATVADRVTGRAAAILCVGYGVAELHTKLLSERAIEVLKEGKISFSYDKMVAYIKNRTQTDSCPVEKISAEIVDVKELMDRIEIFLNDKK